MQEVDADAIQVGVELRESVEPGLDFAPVVIARPIFADFVHVLERNPLRRIRNGLRVGPAGGAQALFQILEIRVADLNLERPDFIAHGLLLSSPFRVVAPRLSATSHSLSQMSCQCLWGPFGAFCMIRTSIDSVTAKPSASPVSSLIRREGPSNKILFGIS